MLSYETSLREALNEKKLMWSEGRMLILSIVLGCIIGLGIWLTVRVGDQSARTCRVVQQIQAPIVATVKRQAQIIGTKGSSGYEYYLQHPAELAAARQQIADELRAFSKPLEC